MRIPDSMRECVVFVGRILQKGSIEEKHLTGTAFVVSVPLPDGNGYYLVTAKHVATGLVSGGEWFIRFNTTDGCDEIRLDKTAKWWVHPDPLETESVDAAVMPLPLPPTAQFSPIPLSMFFTDKGLQLLQIGPGSDAFIVGLFTKMAGKARNIPLVRMGNNAMMAAEKPPNIRIGSWIGESEVYLLEARSLGGISGSPVFASQTLVLNCETSNLPPPLNKSSFAGSGDFGFLGLIAVWRTSR